MQCKKDMQCIRFSYVSSNQNYKHDAEAIRITSELRDRVQVHKISKNCIQLDLSLSSKLSCQLMLVLLGVEYETELEKINLNALRCTFAIRCSQITHKMSNS